METASWGALLRLLQTMSLAAPTVLIGVFVAAVLQQMVGPERTRRLFGDGHWSSIPLAWLIGMGLPVCSLGCLPILFYLRRSGVTTGAILAFAISAPLFNPISILWGLTLSDPIVIVTFSGISLVVVTSVGVVMDLFVKQQTATAQPANGALGLKRMVGVFLAMTRIVNSKITGYMFIGILGVSCLSFLLPRGFLQTAAERSDTFAPLFMAAIALPAYETPLTAIVKLGDMFQHGNSVGAALTLLILGAGVNVGLIVWSVFQFGWRQTVALISVLFCVSVSAGYLIDVPMTPKGIDAAGHTHAFDVYCNPYLLDTPVDGKRVVSEWLDATSSYEMVALAALVAFSLIGLILSMVRLAHPLIAWTRSVHQLKYDHELSGRTLVVVSGLGLLAGSVFSCYLFYLPRDEILEEMRLANVELGAAGTSQAWDTLQYWLPIQDSWSRKLEVSLFIRGEAVGPYEKAKMKLLRSKLDLLRHAAEDNDPQATSGAALAMSRAYSRLRRTLQGEDVR